jgi:hypothetical protein
MKAVKNLLGKKKQAAAGAPGPAAPAVTPDKLPVMERNVADLPELEHDPVKLALLDLLLSPAACTEKEETGEAKEVPVLEPPEIQVERWFLASSLIDVTAGAAAKVCGRCGRDDGPHRQPAAHR